LYAERGGKERGKGSGREGKRGRVPPFFSPTLTTAPNQQTSSSSSSSHGIFKVA